MFMRSISDGDTEATAHAVASFYYHFAQGISPFGCQLLGVVEHIVGEIVRQYHRRREDRTSQRTASRFVESCL